MDDALTNAYEGLALAMGAVTSELNYLVQLPADETVKRARCLTLIDQWTIRVSEWIASIEYWEGEIEQRDCKAWLN